VGLPVVVAVKVGGAEEKVLGAGAGAGAVPCGAVPPEAGLLPLPDVLPLSRLTFSGSGGMAGRKGWVSFRGGGS
jgi:hypothetical protein